MGVPHDAPACSMSVRPKTCQGALPIPSLLLWRSVLRGLSLNQSGATRVEQHDAMEATKKDVHEQRAFSCDR